MGTRFERLLKLKEKHLADGQGLNIENMWRRLKTPITAYANSISKTVSQHAVKH